MTDNELFNHFKSQSSCFDEMPGDALWAKIEDGLSTKKTIKLNRFLFISCGAVLLAGILFYAFHKNEPVAIPSAIPQTKQIIYTKSTTNVVSTSVIPEKIVSIKNSDSVKKIRFKVITAPAPVGKPIPFTTIIKDSIKQSGQNERIALIKVQELPGKVIVTTTERLTKEEFIELTESITEQHKTELGTVIIIKAPGHQPFRYTIPTLFNPTIGIAAASKNTNGMLQQPDSNLTPHNFIKFIKQRDTITTETIQFKTTKTVLDSPLFNTASLTKQAAFPGGMDKLLKYVNRHTTFPDVKKQTTEKLMISFIVEADGTMSNIKVLKDPGYGIGDMVIKALSKIPVKWEPGEVNGKKVRAPYSLPMSIKFN